MSSQGLTHSQRKMTDADVHPTAIDVFSRFYTLLEGGATGTVPEADVEPLTDVTHHRDLDRSEERRVGKECPV